MENFLNLQKKDRRDILQSVSQNTGKSAQILEKDIWVCWALNAIFSMPEQLPIAFKGGTSLSKIFDLINRFSEDIDLTIDYKAFTDKNPHANASQAKKITNDIRKHVTQYLKESITPHLTKMLAEPNFDDCSTELLEDGETVLLHYPSAIELIHDKDPYIPQSIRLEFGGRNLITPNKTHTVATYINEHVNNLAFPIANVTVLSPERTFREKATLIHVECNRKTLKADPDRISRHWYDLVQLSENDIGKQAIQNTELLQDVVRLKKAFYNSRDANYDSCLNGKLSLVPNDALLSQLSRDFDKMLGDQMFYGEQPVFADIMNKIELLEKKINSKA